MHSPHPPGPPDWLGSPRLVVLWLCLAFLSGCATPGIPRPPSLNLPEPARDLTAARVGDTVELRFTLPTHTTDKLPLKGPHFAALFCRELDHQPCLPIPSSKTSIPLADLTRHGSLFTWTDTLPADLTRGPVRTLAYRVQILNALDRSAGDSAPAFTATGEAPAPVQNFRAEGSRLGILLRWEPSASTPGDIALVREELAAKADPQQLTSPTTGATASLLDTTAKPGIAYRYLASRRLLVQLGGRSVELHSTPSTAVDLTLQRIYPPLAPTGLTTAAFFSSTNRSFAVDLVWQPVDEPNTIVPLAGYILYRVPLDPTGNPAAARTRLNPALITQPSFHDTTADPATPYRYSVTAVDTSGNESGPASALLAPSKP